MTQNININSKRSPHPNDIKINLKDHQLAMLNRCQDIESILHNKFGVMRDKPGTGKTYVVLSIIYQSLEQNLKKSENKHWYDTIFKKNLLTNFKTNIIIVPQNIYTQWIFAIENFSDKLSYTKFITYDNIISLYTNPSILKNSDIILTTTVYYQIIAKTLESINIKINRVFFDEIDSISNMIQTKIDCDFIWFISASFNLNSLGYYASLINEEMLPTISCKCDDDFIDNNIVLEEPSKNYYLCKNIYIDNILVNVISDDELNSFNAMDYTINIKNNIKKNVLNEKEAIELILKSRKEIILLNQKSIEENKERIVFYEKYKINFSEYTENFMLNLNNISNLNNFKASILEFLNKFENYTSFYLITNIEDQDHEKIIRNIKNEELLTLRTNFKDIVDLLYKLNDIKDNCTTFLQKKIYDSKIEHVFNDMLKFIDLLKCLNDILIKINNKNISNIEINSDYNLFFQSFNNYKIYFHEFNNSLNDFNYGCQSFNQLELLTGSIDLLEKNSIENQTKIDLIYERLSENDCCPVCYKLYKDINNKIYITKECCNNKICGECVLEWYAKSKGNCIYCNHESIYLNNLISFNDPKDKQEDNQKYEKEYDEDNNKKLIYLNHSKDQFLKKYIDNLKNEDKKIIIFSDYPNIFKYIENLCDKSNIKYTDLDKGNIKDIDKAVNEYKFGEAKILLSNSSLFGCGMNFENSTEIIFVHKMTEEMEKQVIGRAQRMGRKGILNILYLQYENESIYYESKINRQPINLNTVKVSDSSNELSEFFSNIQSNILMQDINNLNPIELGSNNDMQTTLININTDEQLPVLTIPDKPIDLNLDQLLASLE
jgi:superfamily II DNA or RNA helicase